MVRKLLLHICCGPCAIVPGLELLAEGFKITAWFMNPNIHPLSEYLRRREAVEICAKRLGIPVVYDDESWNLDRWLDGRLSHREKPDRCHWCCESRLEATYRKAYAHNFDFFCTTLLYSRYQPHEAIARKGWDLTQDKGPQFVYRDFRLGWQKGIDLSREWGLYRQPYCGCIFSEVERYAKKLSHLQK